MHGGRPADVRTRHAAFDTLLGIGARTAPARREEAIPEYETAIALNRNWVFAYVALWRFAASGWWDAAPKNQVRY
jgi:hypothetical protein